VCAVAAAFTRGFVFLPNPLFVCVGNFFTLHLFYYPNVSRLRRDIVCVWNELAPVPCRFRLYVSAVGD
jgi:hypothetical protein